MAAARSSRRMSSSRWQNIGVVASPLLFCHRIEAPTMSILRLETAADRASRRLSSPALVKPLLVGRPQEHPEQHLAQTGGSRCEAKHC